MSAGIFTLWQVEHWRRGVVAGHGSRFNIRFQKGYLKERPATAELVMEALTKYVDFSTLAEQGLDNRWAWRW
jgi:hypothetical protein